jgi:hypothetical protein
MMTMRPKRDYADEAERLRKKAAAKDDGALRNSYLALAREYEEPRHCRSVLLDNNAPCDLEH